MIRLFLNVLLALCILTPLNAASAQTITTPAKQAVIIDYDTGTVLFEKNADKRMPTSSMSKVITMYAVFKALESGVITLEDTFKVSEKAWRKGGSKMFVELNKNVKIEDLIRGVIIQSGNDATIVLAEGLAGSEEAFAKTLNDIAAELGMEASNFKNASGWPDSDHYSTAKDLGKLAFALIKNFPQHYGYYSEKEFTYNDIRQPNRNPLLHQNIGADGIKTGHTDAGGYGLIGSGVTDDGRRVVMVINGLDSEAARAKQSKKLLNWGLQNFKNETVLRAGQPLENADVIMGKSKTVALSLAEDLTITVPKNANINITMTHNAPLQAPLSKGDKAGSLTITPEGLAPITVPLVINENVEANGLISRVLAKAKILARTL